MRHTHARCACRFVAELKLAKLTPEYLSANPRVQVMLDQADVLPCSDYFADSYRPAGFGKQGLDMS